MTGQRGPHCRARAARPLSDDAGAGCRHVDPVCDSNHARGEEPSQRREGGAAPLPGEAFWWHCPAIDTARAGDRGGNCGCWQHTPLAGFHSLLGVARVPPTIALPGSAASHRASGQSLDQRSDQLSRAEPHLVAHILVREKGRWPLLRAQTNKQGQTRWCAPDQDEADDPVPGAGERPTAQRSASTPAHRMTDYTSDPGLVQHPHPQESAQRRHDADTSQRRRKQ